jgi:hypothetical protein
MQVAEEMEALFETKVSRLTDQMKRAQTSLDESRALADAREAELLSVIESTKRKIVEHCKDILSKSKSREDDLQVCWAAGVHCCNRLCYIAAPLQSYVEYVKREYENMIESQSTEHDLEVVSLRAQLVRVHDEVCQLKDQLKGERTQMARKLGAMKESMDNVSRKCCYARLLL